MRTIVTSAAVLIAALLVFAPSASLGASVDLVVRTLDGKANNLGHQDWGQAGKQYLRVTPAKYADGVSRQVSGPSPRYVSNRIFNDVGQNIFSENDISQWGWAWGQFIDHDIGLRDERELATEHAPMAFDRRDALEAFTNDLGVMDFFRTPADAGTGVNAVPRQQINTLSSYIDASQVYGVTQTRLDWLRSTPTSPTLKLPNGYLPRRGTDPNAPPMDLMGPLAGRPDQAAVAGDVRANENIALTAIQTLFVREHNRIVGQLPSSLAQELRFQIARRVVGAEIERITYAEFLPTLGINLNPYAGYTSAVNSTLGNEFAATGFRAHSMIHGEFEPTVPGNFYTADQLNRVLPSKGVIVERNDDGTVTLVIPLGVAFGNPGLLELVGEGTVLLSLGGHQYKNDEQIDNALRSVLFQLPKPGTDPATCGAPVVNPACFSVVADLGSADVQRGLDHGIPSYNALRQAYGLAPITSFTQLTGEVTDRLPAGRTINDPRILDFVQLRDINGAVVPLGSDEAEEEAVVGIRRSTLAARLKAVYGDVSKLDGFTGMISEKHVAGTEFGRLQLAIWKKQFETLRDGDRFFYRNDPALALIEQQFGVTSRHTLAEIVKLNTGVTIEANAFEAAGD